MRVIYIGTITFILCTLIGSASAANPTTYVSGSSYANGIAHALRNTHTKSRLEAIKALDSSLRMNLSGYDIATILNKSTGDWRARMIEVLARHAKQSLAADESAAILEGTHAKSRLDAIKHLESKLRVGFNGDEVAIILGDSQGDWRSRMIAVLTPHIKNNLEATEVASIISGTHTKSFVSAIEQIEPSIKYGINSSELVLILGNSKGSWRMKAIQMLAPHAGSVSSRVTNQTVLQKYQNGFTNQVFHTPQNEATDGLNYLGGQCIAWAESLYDQTAKNPITSYSYGRAANIPNVLSKNGYTVIKDPKKPKIGALVVWDDGKAGHVGVVTAIKPGPQIVVSEANFGNVTSASAMKWGLTLAKAKQEYVTDEYGRFQERTFNVANLDRGSYKFSAYVYP